MSPDPLHVGGVWGRDYSWPLDPDSSHHILCTSPTTHTKAATTTPFPPDSHTLPWIYQDHENRQLTAFQPTCLIKQAICTPPLVKFRHPRTWGTFWSTRFWSFFLFLFITSEWCSFILTYREFLFSLAYCTLQLLRDFFVMHEVLQLLMWFFLPVIWLLNLIVACHHFLAAFTLLLVFVGGGVLQPTFTNWTTLWRICKWEGSRRSTGAAQSGEQRDLPY